MRRKTKLLIIECTSKSKEGMSEGLLLKELMFILGFGKKTRFLPINSKNSFLNRLRIIEEPYLHISAHGDFDTTEGTSINVPYKGKVFPKDLTNLWKEKPPRRIPKLVVLSACETGHVDMIRAFSDAGCRYCIAPLHETYWEDAAVFSTMFYKLLIGEKKSPWISFKNTLLAISDALPRLTGSWSFYEWGEKVLIEET